MGFRAGGTQSRVSVRAQCRVPLPRPPAPAHRWAQPWARVSRLFLQLWVTDQSSQFAGRCFVPFCSPPPDLETTSELSKSRDCFHTGNRPESCICPLALLGCLSPPPAGLCAFLAQAEVLSSSFGSPHLTYKYDLQNWAGPRLAVTQKVTKVFWPLPPVGSQSSTPTTAGQGALRPQEVLSPPFSIPPQIWVPLLCWISTGNDPTQEIWQGLFTWALNTLLILTFSCPHRLNSPTWRRWTSATPKPGELPLPPTLLFCFSWEGKDF